jgi:hypothetical protein
MLALRLQREYSIRLDGRVLERVTMPALAVNNFNIVLTVIGGWVSLFGLVSYLCKETFYLSEARKYGGTVI